MTDLTMTIERLTLECGHFRLSGPWDGAHENGEPRHMIGDITWCEVCPRVPQQYGSGMETRIWQVVNVEQVDGGQYREPKDEVAQTRRAQIEASRGGREGWSA